MTTAENQNVFHAPDLISAFVAALREHPKPGEADTTGPWAHGLLADARRARATDIHLDSQRDDVRVRFRIDGAMREVASLTAEHGLRLLRYFKVNSNLDPAPSRL